MKNSYVQLVLTNLNFGFGNLFCEGLDLGADISGLLQLFEDQHYILPHPCPWGNTPKGLLLKDDVGFVCFWIQRLSLIGVHFHDNCIGMESGNTWKNFSYGIPEILSLHIESKRTVSLSKSIKTELE